MFLVDTNVVSELRKSKSGRADSGVTAWSDSVTIKTLYLSAISLMELEIGVRLAEHRDLRQGKSLRNWLRNEIVPGFDKRILPVDQAVAMRCARLHVPNPRPDRDAMIAATALVHEMTLVTRNTRVFAGTGVRLVNPWEFLSASEG
jgi:predicted nucleic acid-binding protein